MALTFPTSSLRRLLARLVKQEAVLRLYSNDRTPQEGDKASDYREAYFVGYQPLVVGVMAWAVPNQGPVRASCGWQTFRSEANQHPQEVYGYYLTRGDGLVLAERFADAPLTVRWLGDTVEVKPVVLLKAE